MSGTRLRYWALVAGLGAGLWMSARGAEPLDVPVDSDRAGDPLILQGDWTPPRSDGPVLIFLHGLGSTRGEWTPMIAGAVARGWGTYAYDMRGHGQSQRTMTGRAIDYEDRRNARDPAFWAKMSTDLERVVRTISTEKSIALERIFLVGASLGANVALTVGSGSSVGGLVLLSPGLNYAGYEAEPHISTGLPPTLMVAARPDDYSYGSVERLKRLAPKNVRLDAWFLSEGTAHGAHGAQLFDGPFEKRLLDWIARFQKNPSSPQNHKTSSPQK